MASTTALQPGHLAHAAVAGSLPDGAIGERRARLPCALRRPAAEVEQQVVPGPRVSGLTFERKHDCADPVVGAPLDVARTAVEPVGFSAGR